MHKPIATEGTATEATASSILGTWTITPPGSLPAVTVVFVAGGAVQDTAGTQIGTWTQNGADVSFKTGVPSVNYRVYSGTISGDAMNGWVTDGFLPLGEWTAARTSSPASSKPIKA